MAAPKATAAATAQAWKTLTELAKTGGTSTPPEDRAKIRLAAAEAVLEAQRPLAVRS